MTLARLKLNTYTNKVLNVVKAKFDLKDKSAALNRFVDEYGQEVVEKEANDAYIKKILEVEEKHIQKYGKRKMSLKELDELCGVD
ncbi:DUF2683 family protein [Candidatus Woesearchaeota archaeon]|nr:DUF2683 family protein [Candidatus Woesearchaeota archaeon]